MVSVVVSVRLSVSKVVGVRLRWMVNVCLLVL